jgi:N-acetylmuramoyl-L-alanine amidase
MTYRGTTKKYQSSGDVYIAGRNTYVGVRVSAVLGIIYPDLSDLGVIKEYIKPQGVEFIKLDTQTNGYFQLYSGGWIPVGHVNMITGELKISNRLEGAALKTSDKAETITFSGTNKPFFDAVQGENTFTFRMYNSSGTPSFSVADSKLFSSVSVKNENKCTTYTLTFKDRANYWGYDVSYDENGNTMLRLNYKPRLQSGAQPLRGIRVMLDPGHGGDDPGALGLAGTTGPTEDTVNLAHAIAIQQKLTELGAEVYLTRDGDFRSSLDQRLMDNAEAAPDFFLSVHHNSIVESADANTAYGVETYYVNSNSKKLSDTMLQSFSSTGRKLRSSSSYAFRVTLLPRCPAILMELGFMSHPLEYENATLEAQMALVAQSVADGVINTLR